MTESSKAYITPINNGTKDQEAEKPSIMERLKVANFELIKAET